MQIAFQGDLHARVAVIGQGRTTLKPSFPISVPGPPCTTPRSAGDPGNALAARLSFLPPSFPTAWHRCPSPPWGIDHDSNPVPVNPVTSITMGPPTPVGWSHDSLAFWIGSIIPFRALDTPESNRSKTTRSIPGPADSAGRAMRSVAAARRLLSGRIWNPVQAGPGSLGRRVPEPRSDWTTIIARRIS